MAPDFEFFARLVQQGRAFHEFPGIVEYTFPVALLIFLFFHLVLKWPVLSLLPDELQEKLAAPARYFNYRNYWHWWYAVLALWIGIASHLLWDSFTHEDGWAVSHLPFLLVTWFHIGRTALTGFKVAQYGSTFAGAAALLVLMWQWFRRAPLSEFQPPLRLPRLVRAVILAGTVSIACGAGVAAGMAEVPRTVTLPGMRNLVSTVVVTSVSAEFLVLGVFAVVIRVVVLPSRKAHL